MLFKTVQHLILSLGEANDLSKVQMLAQSRENTKDHAQCQVHHCHEGRESCHFDGSEAIDEV
jgi:hypothetical protein